MDGNRTHNRAEGRATFLHNNIVDKMIKLGLIQNNEKSITITLTLQKKKGGNGITA